MTVVLEVSELPGSVPVKMVKGASLTFTVRTPTDWGDPPLSQFYAAIYNNTAAGYDAAPVLVLPLTKTGTREYTITVSSTQSNTLSIAANYRWFFRRTVSVTNTRPLLSGPWKVVAP